MKQTLFILLILSAVTYDCYGQTGELTYSESNCDPHPWNATTSVPPWYKNLEKYWYYRYKLVNDFMLIGGEVGESIPASRRRLAGPVPSPTDDPVNNLNWGSDATIGQGHYLAILATEYAPAGTSVFACTLSW